MRTITISILLALLLSLFVTGQARAAGQQNDDYLIDRDVINAGGRTSESSQYILTGSIGQPVAAGRSDSNLHMNFSGFWGGGAAEPGEEYTLTVNVAAGSGTGSATGPGIACPSDCTEDYASGSSISLTAAADRDSAFVCWKLDDPASDCVYSLPNITRDITVYAIFELCPWPADFTSLSPADGSSAQSLDTALIWQASSAATSYIVNFGASSPPPELVHVTNTSYDPGPLAGDTSYSWRIDAKNECGTVAGPEWSFTTAADTIAPTVTLDLDRREIYLGQTVTIYTSASDNGSVAEFHLTADGTEIGTEPGTQSYTPTATGTIDMNASATDNASNVGSAGKDLYVYELPQAIAATLQFYEGLDPMTGAVERDRTVMIFTPEMRENMSEISFDPALEQDLRFPEGVSWYFSFRSGSVTIVPTAGREAVLFTGRAFDSVTAADAVSATYAEWPWPQGNALGANDTVVIRRKSRWLIGGYSYVKVGNVTADLPQMQVDFSYQQLIAP